MKQEEGRKKQEEAPDDKKKEWGRLRDCFVLFTPRNDTMRVRVAKGEMRKEK